jgi:mono/diheme cytochrome c family protein
LLLAVIKTKSSLTSNALIMFSLRAKTSPPSHAAGFGLRMMGQPTKPREAGVFRGIAPAIGLLIGLAPVMAQAQTNIDQGKSPAEIFANDCGTCHKSARGLANGRGSSGLASFLVEHYTASKDQAAALAAYVMGAGGGEAAPARGPKPGATPDRNRASAEPPPTRPAEKPDQAPPAAGRQGPATASRKPASTPPAQQPAAVVAEPALSSPPAQESPAAVPGPSAAAPANADSGENAPIPRDNIPD